MAITVSSIATPVAGTGTANATTTITLTSGAAVGQVVLVAFCAAPTTGAVDFSFTDTGSNTYTVHASEYLASNDQAAVAAAKLTTALSVGSVITIVTSQSASPVSLAKRNVQAWLLDGADNTLDVTAVVDAHNATAITLTAAASTAANSMAVEVFGVNSSAGAFTHSGWTNLTQTTSTAGSANKSLVVGFKDAGTIGTVITAAPTPTTTLQPWAGVLILLEATAAATTTFYPSVDEATSGSTHSGATTWSADLSDGSDTTYVTIPNGVTVTVKLASNGLSATKTGWYVSIRGKFNNSSGSVLLTLRQGATTIKSASQTFTGSLSTIQMTLNSTQAGNITDGTDLHLDMVATAA